MLRERQSLRRDLRDAALLLLLSISLFACALGGIEEEGEPETKSSAQFFLPFSEGFNACVVGGPGGGAHSSDRAFHAWDFDGIGGEELRAVAAGEITHLRNTGGSNCQSSASCSDTNAGYVVIKHPFSHEGAQIASLYLHLQNEADGVPLRDLRIGQRIEAGQLIGHLGNTGYSFGAHLHFQFQRACAGYFCQTVDYLELNPTGFSDVGQIAEDSCYVAGGSGVAVEPPAPVEPGSNPAPQSLSLEMQRAVKAAPIQWKSKDGQVQTGYIPSQILRAVAWQESNWRHVDAAGQVLKHPNSNGTVNYGLMQINSSPNDLELLGEGWAENLRHGVQALRSRWEAASFEGEDPSILENWYWPLAFYNGMVLGGSNDPSEPAEISGWFAEHPYSHGNRVSYQDRVMAIMEHPAELISEAQVYSEGFPPGSFQLSRPYELTGWIEAGQSWSQAGELKIRAYTAQSGSFGVGAEVPSLEEAGLPLHRWVEDDLGGHIEQLGAQVRPSPPRCPAGDGRYCGIQLSQDPGALYRCQGDEIELLGPCQYGCVGNAPEARCAEDPCPDGLFCGYGADLNPGELYRCDNGVFLVEERCPGGCREGACLPEELRCPDGDGIYCGVVSGRHEDTLYRCDGGSWEVLENCAYGCELQPGRDRCADAPAPPAECPDGDGLYCGQDGRDPGALFRCSAGDWQEVERCAQGCEVAPPGNSDACADEPSAPEDDCPNGDGLYCGATLGLDASTLYNCRGGISDRSAWCMAGCELAPPGSHDACRAGECPSGNGLYCGATASLEERLLYRCNNGAWRVDTRCERGCHIADPGENDRCR